MLLVFTPFSPHLHNPLNCLELSARMLARFLGRWVLGLTLLTGALADTEIRNFRLPLDGPGSTVVPNVT